MPSTPNMDGGEPPMNGQDSNMNNMEPPMDSGEPPINDTMGDGDPFMGNSDMDSEGLSTDDSTISIINQLSDVDREAVRAYAESMLNKGDENTPDMPQNEPVMESVIFSKKQLKKLFENFGPTEDELQKDKNNDTLSRKKQKTVSKKSPFNSPKFN